MGNLTLRDRTDEPVNCREIAEFRPLRVVAEDALLVARVRHLDVTEMRNRIVLSILAVFVSSSRPVIASHRCDRRPVRLNQRQRCAGTRLRFHWTYSFLVFLPVDWVARKLQNDVEVVVLRHLVSLLKTTRDTAMENGVFSALDLNAHGLHESLTCCLAVAGVHVNMLAPQTLRTVISVAASAYKETAPFAGEVLFDTLEFSSSQNSTSVFYC